jgi:hypothetical protein
MQTIAMNAVDIHMRIVPSTFPRILQTTSDRAVRNQPLLENPRGFLNIREAQP